MPQQRESTEYWSRNNTVFKHNNREITSNVEIANHFNSYYLNMAKNLQSKIPKQSIDPSSYLKCKNVSSLFLMPTDENEVCKIITTLKNSSPGHDGIDIKIIKHIKHAIITPLVHLCNQSFSQGKIPNELKIAKVIPIYKKGDKGNFANYRPISILPAFSKIFEKLAYNRIINFLDKHDILSDNQYGFRKGRSTDTAIHVLVEKFYENVENDDIMIGLFIDFSRAFDTISHNLLLQKLYHYGFRGIALDWFTDYLYNRKQFVMYNNVKSNMGKIDYGVPQGSILGPLLFLLYINDICNVSNKISCILFADDTNIFATGKNLTELTNMLNTELAKINQWIQCNRLSLNIEKTNYMIMADPRNKVYHENCKITINGQNIIRVHNTKFLGVIIDESMSWKHHIEYICNKTSKCIGILLRARQVLYGHTLLMLYNALIKPHFIYCVTIWGNTYNKYFHKIHLVQKKVIRIITRSEFYAHTAPLFRAKHIMTIYSLHDYFTGIFVYKSLNNDLPLSLCNIFFRNTSERSSHNLRSVYHRKKSTQFSIKIVGTKIWNNLSRECKQCVALKSFKKMLYGHLSQSPG